MNIRGRQLLYLPPGRCSCALGEINYLGRNQLFGGGINYLGAESIILTCFHSCFKNSIFQTINNLKKTILPINIVERFSWSHVLIGHQIPSKVSSKVWYKYFNTIPVTIRGVPKKSGPLYSNPSISANISPTYTYYIPNQWKFIEHFAELYRFEIATLIEAGNFVRLSPLFYIFPW